MVLNRAILVLLGLALWQPAAAAVDHAVVLAYHHVARDTPASTSVSLQAFESHLELIDREGFVVWPLGKLVTHLRERRDVPDRVVALTFDDAYVSVFTAAYPALKSRGWPFTVFVNSAAIDRGSDTYMSWDQLRELADAGVEIGNHSHSHLHLVNEGPCAARADIRKAQARIEAELDVRPTLFAYPYGEFTPQLKQLIEQLGFTGVGQHSGALDAATDWGALPRFPVSGSYATDERVRSSLYTRPLNVTPEPANGLVQQPGAQPAITLTVSGEGANLDQLACYATGQGRMGLKRTREGRYHISPVAPLGTGRTRFNCTAPALAGAGIYHWWSYLVMVPNPDGSWYGW